MAPVRSVLTEQLAIDDAVRAEASTAVDDAHDRRVRRLALLLEDGATVELPAQLSRFLESAIRSAASGSVIFTSSLPEELTTTTAAEQLGVSRPTLMKMIAAGELPATKVKSHTRLRRDDVLDLRLRREERRRSAADELLRAGEAFD